MPDCQNDLGQKTQMSVLKHSPVHLSHLIHSLSPLRLMRLMKLGKLAVMPKWTGSEHGTLTIHFVYKYLLNRFNITWSCHRSKQLSQVLYQLNISVNNIFILFISTTIYYCSHWLNKYEINIIIRNALSPALRVIFAVHTHETNANSVQL